MTSPYRLEALALHKVGVFDDVQLDFKPIASVEADTRKAEIHLFTGPNGCGKSTLLYAIAGVFESASGFEKALVKTRFKLDRSIVEYKFHNGVGGYGRIKAASRVAHINPIEDIKTLENASYKVEHRKDIFLMSDGSDGVTCVRGYGDLLEGDLKNKLSFLLGINFAVFAYSGRRTLDDEVLGAIQQITASPFENSLSFDRTVRPELLMQWIANNRAESALAQAEGNAAEAATYDRALQRIVDLIRDVCDLEVEFRLQRKPLAVTLKVNGTSVPFSGLPDGLKSIISWVADLALRLEAIRWAQPGDPFEQPIILLLDEVDIHLHPKWQRRILPAIQKLLPNAQVFVSTHSPFVVGSVEDAWVYRLPEPGTASATQGIEGIPSAAGKSVGLILDEVFGIADEFDVETEALFDRFYALRDAFIAAPNSDAANLLGVAGEAAGRGEEVEQIVLRELRQTSRITGRELRLA
jgi:energy-coupling factor transporter ATP-binding protein EcfA2